LRVCLNKKNSYVHPDVTVDLWRAGICRWTRRYHHESQAGGRGPVAGDGD
jgi:hypothetical protein